MTCIQASQEAGKVSGIPISINFPHSCDPHNFKGFGIVNKGVVSLQPLLNEDFTGVIYADYSYHLKPRLNKREYCLWQ